MNKMLKRPRLIILHDNPFSNPNLFALTSITYSNLLIPTSVLFPPGIHQKFMCLVIVILANC